MIVDPVPSVSVAAAFAVLILTQAAHAEEFVWQCGGIRIGRLNVSAGFKVENYRIPRVRRYHAGLRRWLTDIAPVWRMSSLPLVKAGRPLAHIWKRGCRYPLPVSPAQDFVVQPFQIAVNAAGGLPVLGTADGLVPTAPDSFALCSSGGTSKSILELNPTGNRRYLRILSYRERGRFEATLGMV
jgi:hypothetical protein